MGILFCELLWTNSTSQLLPDKNFIRHALCIHVLAHNYEACTRQSKHVERIRFGYQQSSACVAFSLSICRPILKQVSCLNNDKKKCWCSYKRHDSEMCIDVGIASWKFSHPPRSSCQTFNLNFLGTSHRHRSCSVSHHAMALQRNSQCELQ